jgi:3-oxoacyl-[acyl-carrier protein] reductase
VRRIVEDRLVVLVANAGVSKLALIEEMTIQDFDRLFAVNVRAVFPRPAALAEPRLG